MHSPANWKKVPLPERMRNLPTDHRGYPIPANILKDENGVYHFIINDENKRQEQIRLQHCAICDGPLDGEFWFVGGPLSALHPEGAYVDTAQHYECVTYALQVCPYLATRPYKRPDPEKVIERVAATSVAHIYVDPTMLPGQPDIFLLVMTDSFLIINNGQYVKPKSIIKAEAWIDGVRQEDWLKAMVENCSTEVVSQILETLC